jgi:hypothetical protein
MISTLLPNSNSVEFVARRSIIYRLINSGDFFDRLVQNEQIQRWLEKVYRASYIYLAVSIHSIVDFSLVKHRNNDSDETVISTRQLSPGDRIIGVQYRRLKFKPINSAEHEVPTLENGRWRKYDCNYTRGDDSDILEATLDGGIELEDLDDEYTYQVYRSDLTGENFILLVRISFKLDADERMTTMGL